MPPVKGKSSRSSGQRRSRTGRDKTAKSVKRPKTKETTGMENPFVSMLTGADYKYQTPETKRTRYLYFTTTTEAEIPPSTDVYLRNLVSGFGEVKDILLGPDCIVAEFDLATENFVSYQKFLLLRTTQIPGSACVFEHTTAKMPDLLEHYRETLGLVSDSDFDFSDAMLTESDEDSPTSVKPATAACVEKPVHQTEPPWVSGSTSRQKPPPAAASGARTVVLPAVELLPEISHTSAPLPATVLPVAKPVLEIPLTSAPLPAIVQPIDMEVVSEPEPIKSTDPATTTTRKPKVRFVAVDFDKIQVVVPPPEPVTTVLFRPSNPGDSLKNLHPVKLRRELQFNTLRDIRSGGLALDFPLDKDITPILLITSLQGIQVSASLPRSKDSCEGVATGIHPGIPEDEIKTEATTSTNDEILGAKRLAKTDQTSWVVKLTFKGTRLPDKLFLGGRCHTIRPYQPRPLQCYQCGRYGHTARLCRSSQRCWNCAQAHSTKECPNQTAPICCNCGGTHAANSVSCPAHSFQKKVSQVQAAHQVHFTTARRSVTAAAKSYAAAVKAKATGQQAPAIDKPQTPKTDKPASRPNYVPNVAHPRPPATQPELSTIMTAIFKALVLILQSASNDKTETLLKITELFTSQVPGADPALFSLPV